MKKLVYFVHRFSPFGRPPAGRQISDREKSMADFRCLFVYRLPFTVYRFFRFTVHVSRFTVFTGICFLSMLLAVCGCYLFVKKEIPVHLGCVDEENGQHVIKCLEEVEKSSKGFENYDAFSQTIISQSAIIRNFGKEASCPLADFLRDKRKNKNLRKWIIEIMGCIDDKENIFYLIEIIEDETEEDDLRTAAIDALEKAGYKETIEELKASLEIVKDEKIKKRIKEIIKNKK